MIDNRTIFSTVEFDSWAQRTRLIPAERYLIRNYLDKSCRTLEAGVGGGRILLAMKQMGFESLYGFDYVPELVREAKSKDVSESIVFEVGDAVRLAYQDCSFDQIIYLQQVLCLIEEEESRLQALMEACRILKPGGIALFSFLSLEGRRSNVTHRAYSVYLSLFRKLSRSGRCAQSTPWLRLGGKVNRGALLDRGPYVYWYRLEEICGLLRQVGFQTVAIGSTHQINRRTMLDHPEALGNEPIEGILYIVGRKLVSNQS